jgi:cysteine desulfurase
MNGIYLDNSATTLVRAEVREAMLPYLMHAWGNASSMHEYGRQSRRAIETARKQVADLIGATSAQIFFTPCATYSNNTALLGRARWVEANGLGRHLITTSVEHASASEPAKYLQENGWRVTILPVDREGFIDCKQLLNAITSETSIVSIMWANNEVGTVQPIAEAARICADRGIFFHTDAVQVAGKLLIDVSAVPIDSLSISGHKFHAPKGIGVLYVRQPGSLMPLVFGGGQESGLFPGTESVANIVGIGTAAEIAHKELSFVQNQLYEMQRALLSAVSDLADVQVTGPGDLQKRLPGHVSLIAKGKIGAELVRLLDKQGICISSASACSGPGVHVSRILQALGHSNEEAVGSLRISAGTMNTLQECHRAGVIITEMIAGCASQPVDSPISRVWNRAEGWASNVRQHSNWATSV